MTPILETNGLVKHFDGVKALDNFSCSLLPGEIVGLIGPNGAGKTTLFNVISGFLGAEQGEIYFKGRNISKTPTHRIAQDGISRTFQEMRLVRQISVIENVMLWHRNQPGERLSNLLFHPKKVANNEQTQRLIAMSLLESVKLTEKANDLAEALSYGQQKLLTLLCCLMSQTDLLLLDEPISGIAPEMAKTILDTIICLTSQGKSVLMIEHNMEAVSKVCHRIIFMDAGAKICEGRLEEIRNDPRVIAAYLGK